MNTSCSSNDLKKLENNLRKIKEYILFDLAQTKLKDLVTYEYLHYDFFEPIEHKININKENKLINDLSENEDIDINKCNAKVWKNGQGIQCSRNKLNGIDYCRIHLTKRNYGNMD